MPNSKQIVYLSQSQYAELITNGTITVDGVTVTYDENDIYVTPQAEPVTDVRVAGTSVVTDGVANVPIASSADLGVIKVNGNGLSITNNGTLTTTRPFSADQFKPGASGVNLVTAYAQHFSTFYGLAKAAGHDEKNSTEPLGTYTPEAKGAIQSMLGVSDLIAPVENSLVASKAYAIGDVFTANGKLYKATAAITADAAIIPAVEGETIAGANCEETSVGDGFPHDVQVDGVSVVSDGIAKIKISNGLRLGQNSDHALMIAEPSVGEIRMASTTKVLRPSDAGTAVFYGLARVAGDTTQSATVGNVGTYTDNAKASIKSMLGIVDGSTGTVDVSGTTPTITAVENTRYVCGEVTSLDFTPPASGICIVRFTSGSTVTVLTLPSTVKFPEWFDPASLETNTIYEICITDGIYGAVMSWAQ